MDTPKESIPGEEIMGTAATIVKSARLSLRGAFRAIFTIFDNRK
jgi:hypothetical protein